jgi:hypothetical protein
MVTPGAFEAAGSCRIHCPKKKEEVMKRMLVAGILGALLLSGSAIAKPAQNISPTRHPNLAEAQRLSAQAFQRIVDAQKANEWDMNGHAQKAKDLLEQVNAELKLAAVTANAKQ